MTAGRQIAFCAALVGVCLSLLGCGSEEPGRELTGEPFSSQESNDFTENLDEITALVEDGDCEGAESKLTNVTEAVQNDTPPERDEQLVSDLTMLLGDLGQQITEQCTPAETSTEETSPDETETDTEPETSSTSTSVPTTTASSTTSSTSTTDEVEEDEEEPPPTEPPGVGPPTTPPGIGGVDPGSGGVSPSGGSFVPERTNGANEKAKKPKKDKS